MVIRLKLVYNEQDEKTIYSSDVRLIIRSTKDSLASINIVKNAEGKSFQLAKERAGNIDYNYTLFGNNLELDSYLTTDVENKFRDQEVELMLYLPEGTILNLDENTKSFLNHYTSSNNIVSYSDAGHYLKIEDNEALCLDCPIKEEDKDYKVKIDVNDDEASLKINDEGLEIKSEDVNITINEDGIKANGEDVKVNIDEEGINITTDDN